MLLLDVVVDGSVRGESLGRLDGLKLSRRLRENRLVRDRSLQVDQREPTEGSVRWTELEPAAGRSRGGDSDASERAQENSRHDKLTLDDSWGAGRTTAACVGVPVPEEAGVDIVKEWEMCWCRGDPLATGHSDSFGEGELTSFPSPR